MATAFELCAHLVNLLLLKLNLSDWLFGLFLFKPVIMLVFETPKILKDRQ